MELGTGEVQQQPEEIRDLISLQATNIYAVSQLNSSVFCTFGPHSDSYDVLDINKRSPPLGTRPLLPGCTPEHAFVEGGLLFQTSASNTEIHVTEESSGVHVVTFRLFKPLRRVAQHFSYSLNTQQQY
ncbi:hypothetical protein Pelo_19241 [Pelomyxa schiedti]|nr:hypothetical protein Pelo_19241 [Pelomyxa schiedti]